MKVSELMHRSVDLTDPSETIQNAAIKMRDDDVGALPVGENDRLIGMVTDRDIVIRAVTAAQAPNATPVRDVMSPEIVYCFDDDDIEQAAHTMADKQVRRLPVLNRDKRLVGIVSIGDFSRHGGDALNAAREALAGISQETGAARHV